MDQLRRHWEKILLTVALLALLAAAGLLLLKIGALSQEVRELGGRFGGGKELPPLDPLPYQQARQRLNEPVLWSDMPVDPFQPSSVEITNAPSTTTTNAPTPIPTSEFTITLLEVRQVPFTMIFRAYVGEGRAFQLNLQYRPRTFFIEKVGAAIEDQFFKTGYVAALFTPRFDRVKDPSLGVERDVDVSELTVQRAGEQPVVLVLDKPAVHGEPVAVVACQRRGYNPLTTQVRRGQYFRCGLTTYNVVDITTNRMLIIDPQKPEEKPKEIKLQSATPVTEEEGAAGWPVDLENLNQ